MTRSGQEAGQSACPDPANVAWITQSGIGSEDRQPIKSAGDITGGVGETFTKRVSLVDRNNSLKKKKKKRKAEINTR